MQLSSLKPNIGWGGAHVNDSLSSILTGIATDLKLGHLKLSLVSGADANTPITLSGITADDAFLGAVAFVGAGTDVTDVFLIDSATLDTDSITFSVSTAGAKVLIFWVDVDARNVTE